MKRRPAVTRILALALPTLFAWTTVADELPDPDGKPADLSQKVKVFIIMGQSNTLEMGKVKGDTEGSLEYAVGTEGLYPFMVDDAGKWTERRDVRNVHVMGSGGPGGRGGVKRNDWLTVSGNKIGIETGIGHQLGNALDEPVLILKSSIGNRSLGWDLLPPGSPSYEYELEVRNRKNKSTEKKTYVYAGYGESPLSWEKGTEPEPIGWKAGVQYDGDVARAKDVLRNLDKYYPDAKGYEVAGFLWWQGDKDRYNEGHAAMYEHNLNNLISALRKDFNAPDAKFVCATLGQTDREQATGNEKLILDAMLAISDASKYPALKGDVATVYTNPLSMGGASNGHYGGNAKTYMNVGLAMGAAMVELLTE
ncbi:MAG: sialate O-acetylesterase [Planctomycetaceae bacterium]|nr:sialate O-acetylesterase [Planctomycetaceae bacterium]